MDEIDEFPLEESEEEEFVYPVDIEPLSETAITEGMKRLLSKKSEPHLREVVAELMIEWGGARQIARSLHRTYQDAPPGSMTRSRILERVISFMETLSKDSTEEEFDDETIIAVVREEAKKYVEHPKVQLPAGPTREALP